MEIYKHKDMSLYYNYDAGVFGMTGLLPVTSAPMDRPRPICPNFHLAVAGGDYGIFQGVIAGGSRLPLKSRFICGEPDEKGLSLQYEIDEYGLTIDVNMRFIKGANVIRQTNRVTNHGHENVTLTHFSSMNCMGICVDGLLPWHDPAKVKVHYARSAWQGEGQWRGGGLAELGMYPVSTHQEASAVSFNSNGSWSTAKYYPMAVIEDMETGQCWYFEIDSSASWYFEIGHRKLEEGDTGCLYMLASAADELNSGWYKTLKPGESFETAPVAFGCVAGGFEAAVRELTIYRRSCIKPMNAWENEFPVIYNDYMNTLWGNPSTERLLPLIDAAAEAGAEIFCIDAGWFGPAGVSWGETIGMWLPSTERFGKEGLQGVIDYIKRKGMISGLWLEIESCMRNTAAYQMPDECFLTRNGKRIGGKRAMFDFRNDDVREYIRKSVAYLVEMGVGYFKNDYNQSTGIGDDKNSLSPADGLLEHTRALYEFMDELCAAHPHVIFENCGSGALRADNGIMSHFHVQSASDQEGYDRWPSIIAGTMAHILPEQTAVWTYPMPLSFMDNAGGRQYPYKDFDVEQTIFNMVNGICGNMMLSGHINHAPSEHKKLIAEGVSVYKSMRFQIRNSSAVYPLGLPRINEQGYAALGLRAIDGGKLLLAVWRIHSISEYIIIPIGKYVEVNAKVKLLYPSDAGGVKFFYNQSSGNLTVYVPASCFMNTARLFLIE